MTTKKLPTFVSTLWFEPTGASRYAGCRLERVGVDRVRLVHMVFGTVQADVTLKLFRRLMSTGRVRPLDEVPTEPRLRRPKL